MSNGDVTSGTTTDSGTQQKTSTTRAFLRKNKQKSCRYFTNTHELGTIKRNVISVIMCTQTERAQTSDVTRFARDGVGPFDCMCLCVCRVELDTFSSGKRPFTLTKGSNNALLLVEFLVVFLAHTRSSQVGGFQCAPPHKQTI